MERIFRFNLLIKEQKIKLVEKNKKLDSISNLSIYKITKEIEDLKKVKANGVFIYDSSHKFNPEEHRSDLTFYPIPLKKLALQIKNAKSN